jgi:hypothetical protein
MMGIKVTDDPSSTVKIDDSRKWRITYRVVKSHGDFTDRTRYPLIHHALRHKHRIDRG